MPDVLIRDLPEADKEFVRRYAVARGLTQAEVMRHALTDGIVALRRDSDLDRDAVRDVASRLRRLSDPGFEDEAWT